MIALLMKAATLLAGAVLANDTRDPQSNMERVGAELVRGPIPPCQPGHEAALANGVVTIRRGETICLSPS